MAQKEEGRAVADSLVLTAGQIGEVAVAGVGLAAGYYRLSHPGSLC